MKYEKQKRKKGRGAPRTLQYEKAMGAAVEGMRTKIENSRG